MTEQIQETPYTFKSAETFQADALIRKAAHKIICDNVASQETVNENITAIRAKLAQANPKKSGMFSTSYLRNLATKRRLLSESKLMGAA